MKTASYSHCHGESSFHIVFGPKYRHDVFGKDDIKTFCEKCFNEVAFKENFEIRALKVMEDHVHLFVSIPPKFSVSDTVQYFKVYSARKIFLEFPWLKQFEVGEKRFWGGHLWSRGYFFRSVGSTTDQAVEFLSLIHISEPTRLGMISYAVFCLKKKKNEQVLSLLDD